MLWEREAAVPVWLRPLTSELAERQVSKFCKRPPVRADGPQTRVREAFQKNGVRGNF